MGLSCPIRSLTGLQCPGCGATRCVAAISAGDFDSAARNNPLFFAGLAAVFLYACVGAVSPTSASRMSSWVGDRQRNFAICIVVVVVIFSILRNLVSS